jgi:hypothetical protein
MVRRIRLLAVAGVLIVALAWWTGAHAAPTDGNWQLTLAVRDALIDMALVKITTKDGKAEVEMTSAGDPGLRGGKATAASLEKNTLTFTLSAGPRNFKFVAQVPEGEKEPKVLKGVIHVGNFAVLPAVLERTKLREIEIEKAFHEPDELKTLHRAETKLLEQRYKELEEKYPNSPILMTGSRVVLATLLKEKADDAALKAAVDRLRKVAASFGPELEEPTDLEIAKAVVARGRLGEFALPIALAAEKKLPADAPVGVAIPAAEFVIAALKAAKKTDEANKRQADLDKINAHLDEVFEKENIAFKVEPFAGRKGKSTRVALVELFTGAECPPCVAADIGFDASIQAFKPTDAIFLEYHLHIPRPDALTSPASLTRQEYFKIGGTPTFYINGNEGPGVGGGRQGGAGAFKELSAAIATALEEDASAKLALDVKRDGDKITIEATASEVAKPNAGLKLRLVLIEDVARYAGGNRQRLHHHVVRDFPGGADGLTVKEKSATQKVVVSIPELREKLAKYLEEAEAEHGFPTSARPLDLKKLKVVAFLQDDDGKEVLQAIQADVP